MMPERLIEPGSLAATGDEVRLAIRMPWYRALPLSSVASIDWSVDGRTIEPASITWTTDGVRRDLADVPALWNEWWYVLDSAQLSGSLPGGVGPGDHEVRLTLGLRIPYIVTDHGVLQIEESDVKTLRAAA